MWYIWLPSLIQALSLFWKPQGNTTRPLNLWDEIFFTYFREAVCGHVYSIEVSYFEAFCKCGHEPSGLIRIKTFRDLLNNYWLFKDHGSSQIRDSVSEYDVACAFFLIKSVPCSSCSEIVNEWFFTSTPRPLVTTYFIKYIHLFIMPVNMTTWRWLPEHRLQVSSLLNILIFLPF